VFHVKHPTPPALLFLDKALELARERHLLRERAPRTIPLSRCFSSNDYLGLSLQPVPSAQPGAGASRLVSGDLPIHAELETACSDLVQQPHALCFTSGYAANIGVLGALAGPGDLIISDALNHASIVDGARLSRAQVDVVPHLDLRAVRGALRRPRSGRAFVVTESYFSMDADGPDLRAYRQVCDDSEAALIVDEAHALGVLGPEGRGRCFEAGILPDVLVGTFGKAFGAGGAFVAGCPALIAWLWNRARSFVFSTALSPVLAVAALAGVARARSEGWRRDRVLAHASQLRGGLVSLGIRPLGFGPIIPWLVGSPAEAVRVALDLTQRGFDVRPIRPPSVPAGTARIRLTVSAAHESSDVEALLRAIADAHGAG
jgi:8-amino-7-oxononanoate synthase